MQNSEDIDMNKDSGRVLNSTAILEITSSYQYGISYKSTNSEPNPMVLFPGLSKKIVYTILPIKSLDVASQIQASKELCGNETVFILIPGKVFDASGTRHGHGGGWYDRFLSAVPREWLRIGVCYENQLSSTPLMRELWDEPMDFVCVVPLGT